MPALPRPARVRAPDLTRRKLLDAAFGEMYRQGFQAASLDTILARAGVTKGALYHHFPDKAALGLAVVEEVIHQPVLEAYLGRLDPDADDPLSDLQEVLRRRGHDFREGGIALGCPLNNLAQEMSPLDERFRRRVTAALADWTEGFAQALARGQARGTVRRNLNPRKTAAFIVAAVEGAFGMAKTAQSVALLRSNLDVLAGLLDGIRPARRAPRTGRRPGRAG